MKVMLPVKNNKIGKNEIAESFHNIDFVCIYDNNLKTTTWLHVNNISETVGRLTFEMYQQGIKSIITRNISPMGLSMFKRNGINVYKAQSFDVLTNTKLFQANQLKIFTTEESREIFSSCSSSSCSSCSSTCN